MGNCMSAEGKRELKVVHLKVLTDISGSAYIKVKDPENGESWLCKQAMFLRDGIKFEARWTGLMAVTRSVCESRDAAEHVGTASMFCAGISRDRSDFNTVVAY